MKKIMFNDSFGLTEAVLSGRKTMTRRIIKLDKLGEYNFENALKYDWGKTSIRAYIENEARYKVGEVVAIAMSYKDVVEHLAKKLYDVGKWMDDNHITKNMAGWLNKMFVKADLMIFKIRITDVKIERLQDISYIECLREGVVKCVHKLPAYNIDPSQHLIDYYPCQHLIDCEKKVGWGRVYSTPQAAFAELIDLVSGNGTWDSNPYVFAYEFELVD